jgi:hypothetical protein
MNSTYVEIDLGGPFQAKGKGLQYITLSFLAGLPESVCMVPFSRTVGMSRPKISIDALRDTPITTETVAEVPQGLPGRCIWATDRWRTGSAVNLD